MPDDRIRALTHRAAKMRREVVERSYHAKTGHIGSSLSMVDLMVACFFDFLRIDPTNGCSPTRDRFLLSKGHACVPLYAALADRGLLPREVYESYGCEGGPLGHHPKRIPEWGIELGTGSLGHGLSVGAGIAMTAKLRGESHRTVVLMGDGELGEGSVWEAAAFAAHQRLDNLLAIVDFNKMQALGNTGEILDIEPLHERFRSFGWAVRRIDGHDMSAIVAALDAFPLERSRPTVLVADTVKGKGVSFMEGSLLWHYRCPDPREFEAALAELAHA